MVRAMDKINSIIKELSRDYYAMTPILKHLKFREVAGISTMAVADNGWAIYNKNFVEDLSDNELKFLLLHEASHIFLRHPKRFKKYIQARCPEMKEKNAKPTVEAIKLSRLLNIGGDAIINDNLTRTTTFTMPGEGVTFSVVSMQCGVPVTKLRELSAESICELLEKAPAQEPQSGDGESSAQNGDSNQSENGSGEGNGDSQDMTGERQSDGASGNGTSGSGDNNGTEEIILTMPMSKEADELLEKLKKAFCDSDPNNNMEEAIEEAENISNKSQNSGAGSSASKEHKELGGAIKVNNIDWKKVLYALTETIAGKNESARSWRRPSRKYRDIYPISKGKTRVKTKDIVFSIDVSGSMDTEKISKAVSVIKDYAAHNNLNFKYFFFSTVYSEIYNFTNMKDFEDNLDKAVKGGTYLLAAIREDDASFKPNGLVIVSDMEFDETITRDIMHPIVNDNFVLLDVAPDDAGVYSWKEQSIQEYKDTKHYVAIW